MSEECYCGADIKLVPLPDSIRKVTLENAIWVHVESGDTRCCPNDDSCFAEPIGEEP